MDELMMRPFPETDRTTPRTEEQLHDYGLNLRIRSNDSKIADFARGDGSGTLYRFQYKNEGDIEYFKFQYSWCPHFKREEDKHERPVKPRSVYVH